MIAPNDINTVELGRGLRDNPVLVGGNGPPLVYLHGLMGQAWDTLLGGCRLLDASMRRPLPGLMNRMS
jgi:hypothetical protein